MKILAIILVLLALGYVGICVFLYFYQDRLLFFPGHASAAEFDSLAREERYEPWTNAGGERIGWKSTSGDPSNALLICHGNGGFALGNNYRQLRRDQNFQILLLEYPGYGARPGTRSAQAFVAAAIEAIDTLHADPRRRISLMGQSLGTGVVCAAAAARPELISGMVLVTPFDSLRAAAGTHYPWLPVGLLLRHRLDSDKNLDRYHGPVAFLIAGRDGTIPPEHARRLYDLYAGPKKSWLTPQAGHNDLEDMLADWPQIVAWLTSHAKQETPNAKLP